jgi:hypothetical protein
MTYRQDGTTPMSNLDTDLDEVAVAENKTNKQKDYYSNAPNAKYQAACGHSRR